MDPIKLPEGPEEPIVQAIIKMLEEKGWFVKRTHGNMFQSGFPDLWATHKVYGQRWIEVKNPECFKFTAAQLRDFPKMCGNGTNVYVLVAGTYSEYKKLFGDANWHHYAMDKLLKSRR